MVGKYQFWLRTQNSNPCLVQRKCGQCPPPLSEMDWVGGQLRKQNNHFFTPYLHQVQYEGVPLECNGDQTLGVLQSPMREYDIK